MKNTMLVTSAIMTVDSRSDRPIMADPAVRYRPELVRGRRYRIIAEVPRSRTN
ncbi:hypothetical protein JMUB6875_40520 [Nocardia sp. JMUB6875]